MVTQYANEGDSTAGAGNSNRISAWKIQASEDYTAKSIQLQFHAYSATLKIRVALYSGTASLPTNLLNESTEKTVTDTTDWQGFTIPDTALTSGSYYWCAYWANENVNLYGLGGNTGQKVKNSITYSPTASFTTPSEDDGIEYGQYNIGVSGDTPSPPPGEGGTFLPPPYANIGLHGL